MIRLVPISSILSLLGMALLTAACTKDSYNQGTGELSLVQADFVELPTNSEGFATTAVTDDGNTLQLTTPLHQDNTPWIAKADTFYRAALYYNKVDESTAQPVSVSSIPTLRPVQLKEDETILTHPITLESVWKSKGGKYLNIGFYLKTSDTSSSGLKQTISVIYEGTVTHPDGMVTAHLRLYHDQADVPQYYSNKYYLSVLCDQLVCDSVRLTVNTYDGEIIRTLKR
ncbi:MAG: hypothetical protein ACI4BA_02510 [Prevotella sp.]